MRHTRRAITEMEAIRSILDDCQVMRLAMSREGQPYCVPLCFGYDGTAIFFHTGREGLKIDYLRANPRVCFEFERLVRPLAHPSLGCKWSMTYESVVGFGTAAEITAQDERRRGLACIMHQYSGRSDWAFRKEALALCRVWSISISSLTGRRSKHGWE